MAAAPAELVVLLETSLAMRPKWEMLKRATSRLTKIWMQSHQLSSALVAIPQWVSSGFTKDWNNTKRRIDALRIDQQITGNLLSGLKVVEALSNVATTVPWRSKPPHRHILLVVASPPMPPAFLADAVPAADKLQDSWRPIANILADAGVCLSLLAGEPNDFLITLQHSCELALHKKNSHLPAPPLRRLSELEASPSLLLSPSLSERSGPALQSQHCSHVQGQISTVWEGVLLLDSVTELCHMKVGLLAEEPRLDEVRALARAWPGKLQLAGRDGTPPSLASERRHRVLMVMSAIESEMRHVIDSLIQQDNRLFVDLPDGARCWIEPDRQQVGESQVRLMGWISSAPVSASTKAGSGSKQQPPTRLLEGSDDRRRLLESWLSMEEAEVESLPERERKKVWRVREISAGYMPPAKRQAKGST